MFPVAEVRTQPTRGLGLESSSALPAKAKLVDIKRELEVIGIGVGITAIVKEA